MTKRQYNHLHPQHREARAEAFARSGGLCQLCGMQPAIEGHHWEFWNYKPEKETTGDDLTALCAVCHEIATTIRRFHGNVFELLSAFRNRDKGNLQFRRKHLELEAKIKGIRPIIMHSAAGLNPSLPANKEKRDITSRQGKNRSESDDDRLAELECLLSLWLDGDDKPTIPGTAIRSCIETSARKLKQGPQVREGLVVLKNSFTYDKERYGVSLDELVKTTQFQSVVVNPSNKARIIRTRAKFETPWECDFVLDVDDELVDRTMLERWLDIGGRRIGLGDWRPEKSGDHGRFETVSLKAIQ